MIRLLELMVHFVLFHLIPFIFSYVVDSYFDSLFTSYLHFALIVAVKFIFNRTSCEKKPSAVQKVATGVHGTADSSKLNRPSTSSSVRQNERNARDLYGYRKSDHGYKKEEDNDFHKQLARKKSALAEGRSNKDSGRRDGEIDYRNASGSRRNDSNGKKYQDNEVEKQLPKQKSRLAEERCSRDSYCLEDMPQKKRKLDGSVAVSKHTEEKMLSDANYRRHYQVFEVTQKPNVVSIKRILYVNHNV